MGACGVIRSGGHDVSSTQAFGIHSINNCLTLGEHCRKSVVAAKAVGVLMKTYRSTARDQGLQWCWPEPVRY